MSEFIRVAIVDDDAPMLLCLESEISDSPNLSHITSFQSFNPADFKSLDVDVVLMDIVMPGINGIEGCRWLKQHRPRIKVVMFSGYDDAQNISAAFEAKADGSPAKKASRRELAAGIERAYQGGSPISLGVANAMANILRRRTAYYQKLSPVESFIMNELAAGRSRKEIAADLKIAIPTLATHISRIKEKTGVASVVRAAFLRQQVV